MTHKHTKGEWKVTTPNNSQFFIASEYHGAICQMPRYYGTSESADGLEEAEANAQLIAAAPDLLHALEQMLTVHNQLIENAHTTAEYIIALAAIQKATTPTK